LALYYICYALKKTLYIIAILVFCCFTFWCCNKRPFATIEITGRVLNSWTKAPMPCQVNLWVGGATPGSKGTTNYGNFTTNADGAFDVKSNAEWNGNDYTLQIIPTNLGGYSFNENYTVNKNKSIDVGDILAGYVVVTCKITINSVSGDSIKLLGWYPPLPTYAAGTPRQKFPAIIFSLLATN